MSENQRSDDQPMPVIIQMPEPRVAAEDGDECPGNGVGVAGRGKGQHEFPGGVQPPVERRLALTRLALTCCPGKSAGAVVPQDNPQTRFL